MSGNRWRPKPPNSKEILIGTYSPTGFQPVSVFRIADVIHETCRAIDIGLPGRTPLQSQKLQSAVAGI